MQGGQTREGALGGGAFSHPGGMFEHRAKCAGEVRGGCGVQRFQCELRGSPEAVLQGGGLVLQQRADHLDRALTGGEDLAAGEVERWVFVVIAGHGLQ